MNERRMQMLQDISTNDRLTVSELAAKYRVSQVTIRSDLKSLDQSGLIRRFHGGAANLTDERISNRLDVNYKIKLRIAARAAELVENGETIIIESGSTNALLARKLGESKEVMIVTNSCFIANYVRDLPRIRIILLGGDYQPDAEVCVGPLTRQALQSFYVDKMFIGSDGYSDEDGFTCLNLQRAEIAFEMSKRAKNSIVLTDSSKFTQRGVARQLSLAEVSIVITDDGIPDSARNSFISSSIELITVPV